MRKVIVALMLFIMAGLISTARAQKNTGTMITAERLGITYNKTTTLVFPYSIKSVDKGSRDILVQKAGGVENVLQVRAAKQAFEETNLTVITSDGSLYSYILNYVLTPATLILQVGMPAASMNQIAISSEKSTDKVREAAEEVFVKLGKKRIKEVASHDVALYVKGIYTRDDQFYLLIGLRNGSNIGYHIRSLALTVEDRKVAKRTASQRVNIEPIYVHGDDKKVAATSEQAVVMVVPKMTIPDGKVGYLSLQEENGGRHLKLKLTNKQLSRVIPF